MRFHEILFKQILKVSAFYLEKQKSSIPKKKFFLAVFSKHARVIPKDGASHLNFPEGFDRTILRVSPKITESLHFLNLSPTFLTLKLKSSAAVKQRRSRCHCRIRDRAIVQKGTSEDAHTAQLA